MLGSAPGEAGAEDHAARMDFTDTVVIKHWDPPPACSVLVVDDDDLIRRHLVSLLAPAGYDVRSATSGARALVAHTAAPSQIVLTDWEMPEMDGPSLCRVLRHQDRDRYTYLILLTNRADAADILMGLDAGADDYLTKGAAVAELLARLQVGRRITCLDHALRISNAEHRRQSMTDSLTGAHNRRSLMKYLPRELERSRRFNNPVAILSCDIDHFKRVNDAFGHEVGDEVLHAFVSLVMKCTRESIDWVARSGGEEFVIVLPETPLASAAIVAEKLRHALASHLIATTSGALRATVSIGVTALETAEELALVTAADLLRAADRCLYASKSTGRDRITCLTPAAAASLTPPGSSGDGNGSR